MGNHIKKGRQSVEYKVQEKLHVLKDTLVNSVLIAVAVIGLPGLVISIFASKFSGNFPFISTGAYLIIVLLLIFSKKLLLPLKIWPILIFGFTIGTSSLISEGLLGDGFLYYIIISIISSMLLGYSAGILTMLSCLVSAFIIALGFHYGKFEINFNIADFHTSVSVWASYILVVMLFTSLILVLSQRINSYLLNVIRDLVKQTNNLDTAKKNLELEIQRSSQIESSLNKSEKKFQNIFNNIHEGIIIFTADDLLIDGNKAFFNLTGFDQTIFKKYKLSDIFVDFENIKPLILGKASNQLFIYDNEILLKTSTPKITVPVEITAKPFYDQVPDLYIAVFRDIRLKKEAEKQILNAIIQTEEKERTRVSQDLHDLLGPLLSAAKLYSTSIPNAAEINKRTDISNKIIELMNEAIKTVKEISNNLSSHVLKSFGLYEAVETFSEKIKATHPIRIVTEFNPEIQLSETIQITLYRVIVELINNTLKYALATKIRISADIVNEKIILTYEDDGKGFDAEKEIKEKRGMGLFNIHSRIKSLGGTITIQSENEKGISVTITLLYA